MPPQNNPTPTQLVTPLEGGMGQGEKAPIPVTYPDQEEVMAQPSVESQPLTQATPEQIRPTQPGLETEPALVEAAQVQPEANTVKPEIPESTVTVAPDLAAVEGSIEASVGTQLKADANLVAHESFKSLNSDNATLLDEVAQMRIQALEKLGIKQDKAA